MLEQKKIVVSNHWTKEERTKIAANIKTAIERIEDKEVESKKYIRYNAPCFQEWIRDKQLYQELLEMLEIASSEFLEANRSKYKEFTV